MAPYLSFSNTGAPDRALSNELPKQVKDVKVAFVPTVSVHRIMRVDDYTEEEIKNCYYHKEEFQAVKDELRETVRLIQSGELKTDTKKFARRGTEFRLPDGARQRRRNKELAWEAVFSEQDAQWNDGEFDPEILAEIYESASKQSQIAAHIIALNDQRDAWNESTGSIAGGFEFDAEGSIAKYEARINMPLNPKRVVHRRVSNAAA